MGEEISQKEFSEEELLEFQSKIKEENSLLREWFRRQIFSQKTSTGGCELEAWLVDKNGHPLPKNGELLSECADPLLSPELSRFNIEFNCKPSKLEGDGLLDIQKGLEATWKKTEEKARQRNIHLMMIGILPTIKAKDLNISNISPLNRYHALNHQIMSLRKQHPITVDIKGEQDNLHLTHNNVLLEAAATSFQIHFQISQAKGVSYYNATKVASAPLVALAANSPFLFGHQLWEESRIALFEQSLCLTPEYSQRVTFGTRFLSESLMEYFESNNKKYLPLLPALFKDLPEKFRHICLHNGTIWRWNRVIVGASSENPHLRIEQRVAPSGPSIEDSMANAAFYYGFSTYLVNSQKAIESVVRFEEAKENFYRAAKYGLSAENYWKGSCSSLSELLQQEYLPMAKNGLSMLGVSESVSKRFISVLEERVRSQQTGAFWQKKYKEKHKCSFEDLCVAYYQNQQESKPIHLWSFDSRH